MLFSKICSANIYLFEFLIFCYKIFKNTKIPDLICVNILPASDLKNK